MLLRFLILVHYCAAFLLKCPEPAQWSLRATSHCPDPSKYFCLKNDLTNGYSENCTVFDFLQPGRKNVLRGGLDADICSSERYQPWPIKFYTNVSTNCIFLLSLCNEEGQVVNDNGNRNTDVTCKCDYSKSYAFLVKPRNTCFCVPSEEDCSCYLKKCPDSTLKLSPDYECINSRKNMSTSKCGSIMNGRDNKDESKRKTQYISNKDNISNPVHLKIFAGISAFVFCIGLVFVFCGNELANKYYRKAYFISKPPDDITIVEGQSVSMEYKLLLNRFAVDFRRNDVSIEEASHINKMDAGCSKTLTITNITLDDGGKYCLETAGIKSKPTNVIVKPLFKHPLQVSRSVEGSHTVFECETEKKDSDVEWFKDDVKITDNTEKQETEEGYIYTFTIKHTNVEDNGTYRIQKNGFRSEVILEVKVLFKRQLKDTKRVEGSHTIFECETEKENGAVEWFKDDVKLTDNTEKLETEKLETEQGYIYKFKIKYTNVNDSGNYRIEKNGIRSEAALEVQVLFIRPLQDIKSMEGSHTIFECETEKENGAVDWFKDDVKLTVNFTKLKTDQGYIYKLEIKHASVKDSGRYRIEINRIRSEAVLEVKALFKRQLENKTIMEGLDIQFECETEGENSFVAWLKDDVPITLDTENTKKETLEGNIHKLTISPARLQDSGIYRIVKNGISSEAVLNVKEMPETIKQMSKNDREEFLKATKSGTTQRYYIRVMIVGKNSAGKTCLLRRLMNKPINDVISTDGLDIERRTCQVDVKTGKWYFPTTHTDTYSVWSDQNEKLADCGFWDFAGQKEFYATHQTFLSTNAVYLLAADISNDFSTKTSNDMLGDKFDSVGDYIDFWIDNIHCYWTDVHNASNLCSVDLNPPVVIVGTGIDKIALDERKDSQQNFQNHLRKILSGQEKRRHLRKTHFLSNKCPSVNREEFKKLREEIFDIAKTLRNWGDNLPSRWIVLEKVIHSKIFEANYTMSYAEAIELAAKCSFPNLKQTTSELDSFLKYEHDIGNIIFFEDVKDFIILDPKWLVDVFKCFVSNKYANDLIKMTEWSELENKGKLLDKLVEKLLEKVPHLSLIKHKQFVLQIMEKFDIIVKPRNDMDSKIFYMPCMIKPAKLSDIIREIGAKKCKKKTSWFMLEFDFLPPSYFNHILVSFVKEKKLLTKKDNQLCIYRNIGLFDINDSRTRVLMICLSQNAIAMQVLQWNRERHCYSDIKNKLIDLVRFMKLRYRINITYTNKFKCSEGNCFENEGRVDFGTLLAESEYRCTEHKDIHPSKDILKSWLTDKEIEEENKNKDFRRCNYCENISVYKCYNCNKFLCMECTKKYNEKNKYQRHELQYISESFKLNNKFIVDDIYGKRFISDVKCLPNGEVVVAVNITQEVLTFSVSGQQRHAIKLEKGPSIMDVMDKNTVAVLLDNKSVAIVDIQTTLVQYIRDIAISCTVGPFIYTENQFHVGDGLGITVIDMSGTEKRRINLSIIPYDMCYDVDSQRIYCIDNNRSQLICIDRDGKIEFTFNNSNWTNPKSLTIDNEGDVLVLYTKRDDDTAYVIKVDSNGKSNDVVISNMQFPTIYQDSFICFHRLTNSVVIGVDKTVYIYKKEINIHV